MMDRVISKKIQSLSVVTKKKKINIRKGEHFKILKHSFCNKNVSSHISFSPNINILRICVHRVNGGSTWIYFDANYFGSDSFALLRWEIWMLLIWNSCSHNLKWHCQNVFSSNVFLKIRVGSFQRESEEFACGIPSNVKIKKYMMMAQWLQYKENKPIIYSKG